MQFVGRTEQLDELTAAFKRVASSGHGTMLTVRGRRQVGKSRLITEFIERVHAPHVFFTAIKNAAQDAQLQALHRDVFSATQVLPDAGTLFASVPADWSDALGRIRLAARHIPVIVVLDELPWAIERDNTLEGRLQVSWDRELQHLPVLMILVGSDLGMMERLTAHDRPLYGRAKQMLIRPFSPAECAAALGGQSSAMSMFDTFLVTGGYPRLVEDVQRSGGVLPYMRAGLSDENSDLVVVAQRSLDAEFPPDAQARRVLTAIGAESVGHANFSSSTARLGESGTAARTAITRGLEVLKSKGVLSIDTPFRSKAGTRTTRYRVDDPYLRLWFRFVEPHLAAIARGRSDLAIHAFEQSWTTWRGQAIEPVIRDALTRLAASRPELVGIEEVGGWWNRDNSTEVDIVAGSRKGVVVIGSIKWRERKAFSSDELRALAGARAVVPDAAAAKLLAVCPAGLRPGTTPDLSLGAEQLLAGW